MSNARLRRKLEHLPTPVIAAMIDLGHVHDDGGILEFDYYGYNHPGQAILQGTDRCTIKERPPVVPFCNCKASMRDGQHMAWCPAIGGTGVRPGADSEGGGRTIDVGGPVSAAIRSMRERL